MASSRRGEFSPAKYAVDLFGDSTNNRERESEIRQKDNGILVRWTAESLILVVTEEQPQRLGWCYWVCTALTQPRHSISAHLLPLYYVSSATLACKGRQSRESFACIWLMRSRLKLCKPKSGLVDCLLSSWNSELLLVFFLFFQIKLKRWRMPRRHRQLIWRSQQSSHAHPVAAWLHPPN